MTQLATIFVSSSGRSGSKALRDALGPVPEVAAYHGRAPLIERENCLFYFGKLRGSPVAMMRRARARQIATVHASGRHYLESSWFLSALGAPIKRAFPEAKIIHLIRDGRDFVRSGMARRWFRNHRRYLRTVSSWSRDRWEPPREAKSRIAKISWLWAVQQRHIAAHADTLLRFEDLVRDGFELGDVLLPLEGHRVLPKANATGKHVIPRWPDWIPAMREDCQRWAGEELQRYGYRW